MRLDEVALTEDDPPSDRPLTRAERNIKWCQDFLFLPEGKYVGVKLELSLIHI